MTDAEVEELISQTVKYREQLVGSLLLSIHLADAFCALVSPFSNLFLPPLSVLSQEELLSQCTVHLRRREFSQILAKTIPFDREDLQRSHASFRVGDRVVVTKKHLVGTVRYFGAVEFSPDAWVGIELDKPGQNTAHCCVEEVHPSFYLSPISPMGHVCGGDCALQLVAMMALWKEFATFPALRSTECFAVPAL